MGCHRKERHRPVVRRTRAADRRRLAAARSQAQHRDPAGFPRTAADRDPEDRPVVVHPKAQEAPAADPTHLVNFPTRVTR